MIDSRAKEMRASVSAPNFEFKRLHQRFGSANQERSYQKKHEVEQVYRTRAQRGPRRHDDEC